MEPVTLNKLSPQLASRISPLEDHPSWQALLEWVEQEEKGLLAVLNGLNVNAEPHVWERQIGQARGVSLAFRLLRKLPSDAKIIMQKENLRNA